MKWKTRSMLSALVMTTICQAAWAASVTTSITDIRIEGIDLTPEDGLTGGIRWPIMQTNGSKVNVQSSKLPYNYPIDLSTKSANGLFSPLTLEDSHDEGSARAVITSSGLIAEASAQGPYANHSWASFSSSKTLFEYGRPETDITVLPFSALHVSARMEVAIDRPENFYGMLLGEANVTYSTAHNGSEEDLIRLGIGPTFNGPWDLSGLGEDRIVDFTIENPSTQVLTVALHFSTRATIDAFLPPIPEPSSVPLVLSGVAVLAGWRSRKLRESLSGRWTHIDIRRNRS